MSHLAKTADIVDRIGVALDRIARLASETTHADLRELLQESEAHLLTVETRLSAYLQRQSRR